MFHVFNADPIGPRDADLSQLAVDVWVDSHMQIAIVETDTKYIDSHDALHRPSGTSPASLALPVGPLTLGVVPEVASIDSQGQVSHEYIQVSGRIA